MTTRRRTFTHDMVSSSPRSRSAPHDCPFVRFQDRLMGPVQLRREELTGALAPLQDERFFEQVFIDYGALAWPGEIDLAPDAMYAEVAGRPLGSHEPQQAGSGKSHR
jgi:hypothetical protein